jgi:DNA-binding NtrC family response regulator
MAQRVLIVDDTKNIRRMLTKCLELDGYQVDSAGNGREGLDAILAGGYDLIFLDIKLPEISGTEVLRRMRAAGVQTPVIVITAYPTIKNAVECTRLGVVSYLQKPFTAERLKNLMADLDLERTGQRPADLLQAAEDCVSQGDLIRARNLLNMALGEDPGRAEIYDRLARVYALLGDGENSEKYRRAAEVFR